MNVDALKEFLSRLPKHAVFMRKHSAEQEPSADSMRNAAVTPVSRPASCETFESRVEISLSKVSLALTSNVS